MATRVPINALKHTTLTRIIEDYVTREGTNYGHQEFSLEEKVAAIYSQLKQGTAIIWFDEETETCTILPKD